MVAAANLVVLVAAEQQKVLAHFRAAQALSPATALVRESLPVFELGSVNSLEAEGVLKATSDGRLYLDASRLTESRKQGRSIVRIMLVLTGLLLAGLIAVARYGSAA